MLTTAGSTNPGCFPPFAPGIIIRRIVRNGNGVFTRYSSIHWVQFCNGPTSHSNSEASMAVRRVPKLAEVRLVGPKSARLMACSVNEITLG